MKICNLFLSLSADVLFQLVREQDAVLRYGALTTYWDDRPENLDLVQHSPLKFMCLQKILLDFFLCPHFLHSSKYNVTDLRPVSSIDKRFIEQTDGKISWMGRSASRKDEGARIDDMTRQVAERGWHRIYSSFTCGMSLVSNRNETF